MKTSYQEVWNEIYKAGYYTHYPNESIVRFIFKTFGKRESKQNIRILDMGCGTGNNTWMLAREGYETYAFDGSSVALMLNRKRLKNWGEGGLPACLVQGSFLDLAFCNEFFDAIVDDASVQANTSQNIELIFREIYRILKKGGTYFGRLISADSLSSMSVKFEIEKNTFTETVGSFVARKRTIHFFEQQEIKSLLEACGFSDIKIDFLKISDNNSKDFVKSWLVEAIK